MNDRGMCVQCFPFKVVIIDVYIVSYARTPIGNFQGSLSSLSACELGAIAIKEAVSRAGLTDRMNLIDEVLMGNVLSAGLGQAPATSAMRLAGLPSSIPSTTVNKVCSSGMKAIMMAASSIKAGQADIVLAGGMESMSKAPFLLPNARGGMRFGDQMLVDGLKLDGLTDTATGWVMGKCGEKCAEDYGIGRAASDEYAKGSYEKAIAAAAQHSNEIVPVLVQGKEPIIVSSDEPPKNVRVHTPSFPIHSHSITHRRWHSSSPSLRKMELSRLRMQVQ